MTVDISTLREFDIFEDLSEETLQGLSGVFVQRTYRRGEIIFTEGQKAERFYILRSGKVKITKASVDGREVIIEIILPGEVFGAMAVFQGGLYPATSEAMEQCSTVEASREALLEVCERFPGLLLKLTSKIAERVKESHEMLKGIAFEKVEARIARVLMRLAEKVGRQTTEGIVLDMRLTKQDLAEMTGTTVETAIRTMSKLKKQGLIAEDNRKVIILKPSALEELYGQ